MGRAPWAALGLLLLAALALRLQLAWSGVEALVLRVTSDDAYYYFQIARHVAAGAAPSLDGETPTNGFHPLWLAVVAAVEACVADPVRALHVALTVSALLGTATVALGYDVARLVSGRRSAALLAAAAWALHPTAVADDVNGLETGLAVFTIALTTRLFLGASLRDGPPSLAAAAGLGAAGGAMLLARTDSIFVWVPVWLWLAWRGRRGRDRLVPLVAGGVSALLVLPWLAWSWLRFGSIVQVSARALAEPLREDYLAQHGHGLATVLARSAAVTRTGLVDRMIPRYFWPRAWPLWPFGMAAAAGLAALLLRPPAAGTSAARRRLALLAVPGSGIAAALLYHAAWRWWLREWYFAPAAWLAAVLLAVAVARVQDALEARVPRHRRAASAAALLAPAALLAVLLAPPRRAAWLPPSPHRLQQLEAARWLAAHTEPGARVGAFNAGILAYFSGRTVVNLDGAVNAEAYRAKRSGHLLDYVLARRLDFVVDWRGTLPELRCGRSPAVRCERVAVVGEHLPGFAGSPILVLRVEPAGPGG